ncbi:UNVERIFIED_CONTAM: movement protein [Sesamum latifolium]|uniref:Movement protein n=1 Tax=Sesamum latifolium TaxID=2727402 RepID=A0AAW2UUW8_9LAMI
MALILNLDIIDFRNTEKLIDEWVAALKIVATTLELDRENFIRLVELSLEGAVKIGWHNTPEDTKANILSGDSKSAIAERLGRLIKIHFIGDGSICAVDEYIYWFRKYFFQSGVATEVAAPMFFAKIYSPWREMLIQSYKVPEGQLDSVARRMSFLKDKLKDWCYQASIQKNMKRLRGEGHGGPNPRPEPTNLDRGSDQQGLHPKDLDEQIPDPQDEPLLEELSDGPIPELMRVSKIAIAGPAEQRVTYLQTARRNGELCKFKATNDILDAVYYGDLVPVYQFEDILSDKSVYEEEIETDRMDLQPSQSNYNEGDMLQTSESLSGFFSRMTVSNKTMERIMRQDSNLSPHDGFRIGGIGRVLNQIGLNQRRHHIIYKVSSGEFAIPMELTGNVMEMQLIPKEEILEELSKLREEVVVTMKWIHIGAIEVIIKATFKEGIDSEIHLSIMDRRINNLRDGCLGTMIENLYAGKLMFDIHPRIAYNLADQDFSRVLTLHQDFKRKGLMKGGNRPYSITYRIAYALSNTHHSDLFLRKEYIEIPRIFKEFAKQPVIGRYEGMLEIADHEILVAGVAGKENGSMTLGLNFLEDHKPWGRKGSGICTAKPGVFPKEAMEILPVIAGRDFSQKILILNKGIREAKIMIGGAFGSPWFRVKTPPIYFHDTGADILLGNNFIQTFAKYVQDNNRNLLIFTTNCGSEIQVMQRDKAFNRIMPINFRSKCGDFDAKLTHPKMQDKRKFGKALLSFRQQGLIESDSFYGKSEKEIINLKEALQEIKSLDISKESRLSLENVKRLIQRNFSENPLAWWDRNKIEATLKVKEECKYEYVRYKPIQMNMNDKKDMQEIIKEHINLGLIESLRTVALVF